MSLFVDTSVWSLAFRRDSVPPSPQVRELVRSLEGEQLVCSTGIVLQELLQGFSGPKSRSRILEAFSALPLRVPDRNDYVGAADLRNLCRRSGVQAGTIDALLAQLCIRNGLQMLSTDRDFAGIAQHTKLQLWHA